VHPTGNTSRDEDGKNNSQAGELLATDAAEEEGDSEWDRGEASPKLWIRSASRATDPESRKIRSCATAATPRTARLIETALTPSRDRMIEPPERVVLAAPPQPEPEG